MFSKRGVVLFSLCSLALAYRPKYTVRAPQDNGYPTTEEYDYVIIGGGTSGLTVGDRLSEDGKSTVLVIEYGYYDTEVNMNPKRMFNITSVPQGELENREFTVGVGCVVGGSSIVNGQKVQRGTKPEYDAWKELGGPNSTWDWEGLRPYMLKAINFNPPNETIAQEFNIKHDEKYWGDTSRVYATYPPDSPAPVHKLFYNAMANMPGVTTPDAGAGEAGLYWYPMSRDNGGVNRSSARTGHWEGLNRPNYEMIVGAKANKILFDGTTATGVQYVSRNDTSLPPVTVKARKHVILAAGTIHTPQVLIQSGVGPASVLKAHNIPVIQDLPGVGSNFQDHMYIPSAQFAFEWGIIPNGTADFDARVRAPWLSAFPSMPVMTPSKYEGISESYESQDPTSHLPSSYTPEQVEGYKQQQKVYAKLIREKNAKWNEMMLFYPHGTVQHLHPLSRGIVLPPANDSSGAMRVDYRALSNPLDLDIFVEIVRYMRKYMLESDLKAYQIKETIPGPDVQSDEDLKEWARGAIIPSVFHPVGTAAKMPREWGGVVDEELGVHGLKGLTIVDASIIPTLPGVATQHTVYAIAEKAVDYIKAKSK